MSNKVVLDYGDSLLKESDLKLLTSSCSWLNDTLIGFYFEYLSKEVFPLSDGVQRMKFFSPQATQCMKLSDCPPEIFIDTSDGELSTFDWLFFAVNNSTSTEEHNSGSHWSLMVYSKEDAVFYHLDSAPGINMDSTKMLYDKLKGLFLPEPILKEFPCERQANGYDCGLHVLLNARLLGDYIMTGKNTLAKNNEVSTASPSAAQTMRNTLATVVQLKRKLATK